jgi:hypothetical protein
MPTKKVAPKPVPEEEWPIVYTFKYPSQGWDEYEGMYVYPTVKAAERFCLNNVEPTRLHYYVVDRVTDEVIAEYHPKPKPIGVRAARPPAAKRRVIKVKKKKEQ